MALIAGNVLLWLVPSDVVELVARDRHTLLGRYSLEHFLRLLGLLFVSALVLYVVGPRDPRTRKRTVFQLMACAIGFVPSFMVVDIILRLKTQYPYKPDPVVYRRPPHAAYDLPFVDEPQARRSYPQTPPGYGRIHCKLTFDAEGFRNTALARRFDAIALGDSFTEGSRVSDDQPWSVQLANVSGMSVRNLGISGYSPPEYLASLREFGLKFNPRLVLCMVYEGNGFRKTRTVPKTGVSLKQIIKISPLVLGLRAAFIDLLGPLRAEADVGGLEVLSWLPLAVPEGSGARYYAFAPKQLLQLYVSEEAVSIFLQAYNKLPSYEGRAAFGTWLYRLAVNRCLDHLRSGAAQRQSLTRVSRSREDILPLSPPSRLRRGSISKTPSCDCLTRIGPRFSSTTWRASVTGKWRRSWALPRVHPNP